MTIHSMHEVGLHHLTLIQTPPQKKKKEKKRKEKEKERKNCTPGYEGSCWTPNAHRG